jgi:hypothetical protein
MPHIDELIGVATVATAGLFGSIAVQGALAPERIVEIRPAVSKISAVGQVAEPRAVLAVVARRTSAGAPTGARRSSGG